MAKIKVVDHQVVYDNPIPNLLSRHGYFPAVVQLPGGELLALFAMGEAFEATHTMCVTRSGDAGRTWQLQGPLYDKSLNSRRVSDSMKPALLDDGTLIATGYRFNRDDPEMLVNPQTGGLPDGANIISFSQDDGHTWTIPQEIQLSRPEILETSGPCVQLRNGDIVGIGPPIPMWDGATPSGDIGVLLRSCDQGKTWDDQTLFFQTAGGNISPYESRLCEMQDGRLVAIVWAFDAKAGHSLPNMVTVSHDNGFTWSRPIDTGIEAQASNLMYLGRDRLLTIHAHREGRVGLFVRIVDFSGDKWRVLEEAEIWNRAASHKITGFASMGALKFGQPSLLQLDNGEILATHWAIEQGQGRILSHRLRI